VGKFERSYLKQYMQQKVMKKESGCNRKKPHIMIDVKSERN